jgi:hypothetical protein
VALFFLGGAGMFLLLYFLGLTPKDSPLLTLLLLGVLMILAGYLGASGATAKLEVTLDNDTLSIKSLKNKKYFFNFDEVVKIPLHEIVAYDTGSGVHELKIETKEGKIYRLRPNNSVFIKVDYFEFISEFTSAVKHHNEDIKTEVERKAHYETPAASAIAALSMMPLILLLISVTLETFSLPTIQFAFWSFFALCYLIPFFVYRFRKKVIITLNN